MFELRRLRAEDETAVLQFELANRRYFAASITDRGDHYFEDFGDRFRWLLDDQAAGNGAYYVLSDDDERILGRFNLILDGDGSAELGYRLAQHVAGRGVATATVRRLCEVATEELGLRTLRAATARDNPASARVLAKAGFLVVGPADPAHLGGKTGTWYQLDLQRRRGSSDPVP